MPEPKTIREYTPEKILPKTTRSILLFSELMGTILLLIS